MEVATRCLNLTNERISIDKFIHAIKGYAYKEITEDELRTIFKDRKLGTIERTDNFIEIDIDDYIITLYNRSAYYDSESLGTSVINLNTEVAISKTVTVWVSESGCDYECEGKIKSDTKRYYLSVTIDVV